VDISKYSIERYIIVLDEGTASAKAIIFDKRGETKTVAQYELSQYYPYPEWVEQDAEENMDLSDESGQRGYRDRKICAKNLAVLGNCMEPSKQS